MIGEHTATGDESPNHVQGAEGGPSCPASIESPIVDPYWSRDADTDHTIRPLKILRQP